MAAHVPARLDGVVPHALRTSPARLETAAIMAPLPIKTNWMVARVNAAKVGAEPIAAPTSPAMLMMIAVVMATLRTRTAMMAVNASANSDGKVTVAMLR